MLAMLFVEDSARKAELVEPSLLRWVSRVMFSSL